MEGTEVEQLPGFRFHPTEEELLDFYLKNVVHGNKSGFDIIGTLDLYRYDPWDLPSKAKIGEREWYFFVPRDRRHATGGRPNRTTERGFWKATGSDRPVRSATDPKRLIGLKKTLVFYQGRAPRGTKTDWVMNEFRLPDRESGVTTSSSTKVDIVLCKIYRKATSLKELEQRAVKEDDFRASSSSLQNCASTTDTFSSSSDKENAHKQLVIQEDIHPKKEVEKEMEASSSSMPTAAEAAKRSSPELELQVPKYGGAGWDWMQQDPFLTQLRSPWMVMDAWSPYANLLNF